MLWVVATVAWRCRADRVLVHSEAATGRTRRGGGAGGVSGDVVTKAVWFGVHAVAHRCCEVRCLMLVTVVVCVGFGCEEWVSGVQWRSAEERRCERCPQRVIRRPAPAVRAAGGARSGCESAAV